MSLQIWGGIVIGYPQGVPLQCDSLKYLKTNFPVGAGFMPALSRFGRPQGRSLQMRDGIVIGAPTRGTPTRDSPTVCRFGIPENKFSCRDRFYTCPFVIRAPTRDAPTDTGWDCLLGTHKGVPLQWIGSIFTK